MADILRIKRRTTGSPGAPSGLANAEIAYNEVDHVLYYGEGTGGAGGTASVIVGIGGQGLAYASPAWMDGTGSAGSVSQWSRGDHVHPSDTAKANLANPSFTGTVTIGGTITGAGMTAWSASPGPIGSTTPSSGAFTTLSISGAISGTGFTGIFAAPPPIGSTTANTGAFTTLSASSTVSGTGFSTWAASPPAIGSTAASSGAFTTLSASSTVSGTGFSTYLASPPAIGGTTAAAGSFTTLTVSSTVSGAGITSLLSTYAKIDSQTFTGNPVLPVTATMTTSPANGTNSTVIATTQYVRSSRLDQFAVPTAAVSMNSQAITNLLDPVSNQDAATKKYVDNSSTGLSARGAVAVGTAGANITLSLLQTIDGYTTLEGDRVLVKDQTAQQNNGIYIAHDAAHGSAWTRATDMDAWSEVPNAYVFVSNGTVNSASSWVCNSGIGGTIGTTPITWVQFSQQAQVSAGAGLTRTGNQFDVIGTANRIVVLADSIDIDSAYVGQASITTLGGITTGTWNATTIGMNRGGTGSTAIASGYVLSNGAALVSQTTIPNTVITGLGTMSTQFANNVAITGGTIDGVTLDGGVF